MKISKRVLIVEDHKPMANALKLGLERENLQAEAVFDGQEALNILREYAFDLILLDLGLPKVDGFQVLKELRDRGNHTPVFVLTNMSMSNGQSKALELGATKYIVKSDTPMAMIIETIKSSLQI